MELSFRIGQFKRRKSGLLGCQGCPTPEPLFQRNFRFRERRDVVLGRTAACFQWFSSVIGSIAGYYFGINVFVGFSTVILFYRIPRTYLYYWAVFISQRKRLFKLGMTIDSVEWETIGGKEALSILLLGTLMKLYDSASF